MATKEEILDSIANMTVLELSELLKEFEELTFQEIADALGIPLSTVKGRLYTALRQLRLRLERFETEVAPE